MTPVPPRIEPAGAADIVPGLAALDPASWDALVPDGGLYASHRFISAVDEVEPPAGATGTVVVLRSDEGLLGALPVWRGLPLDDGRYDPRALARSVLPALGDLDWSATALLGTRVGYSNVVPVGPEVPTQRSAVLRSLVEAAVGPEPVAMAYLDAAGAAEMCAAIPGSTALLTGADSVLTLPTGGVEEYLESLPSKRRVEVRRELRHFAESGLQVEQTTLADAWPELAELLARRLAKYGSDASVDELTHVLEQYGRHFGSDAVVLLARDRGMAVAYVSLYRWGDALYARSWGTTSDDRRSAAYFNLVYYEPVRRAAELGARRLHLGLLAYEAKVRRGAYLEPRWTLLRHPEADPSELAGAAARFNESARAEFAGLGVGVDTDAHFDAPGPAQSVR